MLTASLQPIDMQRAGRALLAWTAGDKQALDLVLEEVGADPAGPPGLLFAVLTIAANLAEETDPGGVEGQLVRALVALTDGPEPGS